MKFAQVKLASNGYPPRTMVEVLSVEGSKATVKFPNGEVRQVRISLLF